MEPKENILAEHLYNTYCKEVGGKAHDGKPLPNWAEFSSDPTKSKQSSAWVAVAREALTIPVYLPL